MVALTSISPTHVLGDIQNTAMLTWHNAGWKVYSLNSKEEIEIIKDKYPFVTFVPDTRCYENKALHGKTYISIASFFDFGETLEDNIIAIVNSDIQLRYDKFIMDKIIDIINNNGFVIGKRYNYVESFNDARVEGAGIDFFCTNRECLPCFPRTYEFVMGQCWWDYWLPTLVIKCGIPLYKIVHPLLYHKRHPLQWSQELWYKLAELFCQDTGTGFNRRVPQQASTIIHNTFYDKAIPIR